MLNQEMEQTLRLLSLKKRKKASILVLGRDEFSDNSKYLFIALATRTSGVPVYWGSFNPKLIAELRHHNLPVIDLAGDVGRVLSTLLEISCVVYCTNPADATRDSIYRAALAGAHKLQLWHGIGVKRLNLQMTADANLLNPRFLHNLAANVDIDEVLSPSSLYDDQWREAFGVERVLRAGFPRNEVLVRAASDYEMIDAPRISSELCEKGFLLYAPTWTPNSATPVWLEKRLLDVLEGFAQRLDLHLAIKPHPLDREPSPFEASRLSASTLLLNPKCDVYPVLRHARGMITDFSSIASDFMLCDKPVIFFRTRPLKTAPAHPELPGRQVQEETVEAFTSAWESIEQTAPARRRLRQSYFETDPAEACDTIMGRLAEIVEEKS